MSVAQTGSIVNISVMSSPTDPHFTLVLDCVVLDITGLDLRPIFRRCRVLFLRLLRGDARVLVLPHTPIDIMWPVFSAVDYTA